MTGYKRDWVVAGLVTLFAITGVQGLAEQIRWPRPPTISEQTTYFLGPVDADGYVDYVAALNQRFGDADAKPEDNVFAGMLEHLDLSGFPESSVEVYKAWQERFGIDPDGNTTRFVRWQKWIERHDISRERFGWMIERTWEGPWQEEELPLVVKWLDEINPALDGIVAATHRGAYFAPLIKGSSDRILLDIRLPHLGEHREVARALRTRMMRSLGSDKIGAAVDDLIALERLARWQTHEPMSISNLVGIAIDTKARGVYPHLLSHPALNLKHLRRLDRARRERPEAIPIDQAIAEAERVSTLEVVTQLAAGRVGLKEVFASTERDLSPEGAKAFQLLESRFRDVHFDLDAALRHVNDSWSMLDQARADRLQRLEHIEDVIRQIAETMRRAHDNSSKAFIPHRLKPDNPADSAEAATAAVDALIRTMLGAQDAGLLTGFRSDQYDQLNTVAIVLAEHRLEHGTYPQMLEALVPHRLPELPLDFATGEPLRYRPTDDGQGFVLYSVGVDREDDGGVDRSVDPEGDLVLRVGPAD